MSKKGQHHETQVDPSRPRGHEKSRGPNNPSKSVEITTGSYKKPETYVKQQHEHKDPHKVAQHDKNEWSDSMLDEPRNKHGARARVSDLSSGRSGSESNAS